MRLTTLTSVRARRGRFVATFSGPFATPQALNCQWTKTGLLIMIVVPPIDAANGGLGQSAGLAARAIPAFLRPAVPVDGFITIRNNGNITNNLGKVQALPNGDLMVHFAPNEAGQWGVLGNAGWGNGRVFFIASGA